MSGGETETEVEEEVRAWVWLSQIEGSRFQGVGFQCQLIRRHDEDGLA